VRELSTSPETTALQLGRPVEGSDGQLGKLTDLVVRPDERLVTHLVVEDRSGAARLVPAELLVRGQASGETVVLSCSSAELEACPSIRSFSYVGLTEAPTEKEGTDIGVEDVEVLPGFGALSFGDFAGDVGSTYGVTYDSIPAGSAELRRESSVVAGDEKVIGSVDSLLVEGQRITHVVAHHAHLLGKGTSTTIPIDSVVTFETDRVTVAPSAGGVDSVAT
jgi:hypothetical protein